MSEGNITSTDVTELSIASLCNDFILQGMDSHCNGCIAFEIGVYKYLINKDVYFQFASSDRLFLQAMLSLS